VEKGQIAGGGRGYLTSDSYPASRRLPSKKTRPFPRGKKAENVKSWRKNRLEERKGCRRKSWRCLKKKGEVRVSEKRERDSL